MAAYPESQGEGQHPWMGEEPGKKGLESVKPRGRGRKHLVLKCCPKLD